MHPPELSLKGRTARAHIDKWQQYAEKATQHATSAALILIEVKAALSHGQYTPWLTEHGIAERTARRLVLEHQQPEKRTARQEAQTQRNRATHAQAKSATSGRFDQQKPATTKGETDHGRQYRFDEVPVREQRAALVAYIRHAPDGEVRQIFARIRPVLPARA